MMPSKVPPSIRRKLLLLLLLLALQLPRAVPFVLPPSAPLLTPTIIHHHRHYPRTAVELQLFRRARKKIRSGWSRLRRRPRIEDSNGINGKEHTNGVNEHSITNGGAHSITNGSNNVQLSSLEESQSETTTAEAVRQPEPVAVAAGSISREKEATIDSDSSPGIVQDQSVVFTSAFTAYETRFDFDINVDDDDSLASVNGKNTVSPQPTKSTSKPTANGDPVNDAVNGAINSLVNGEESTGLKNLYTLPPADRSQLSPLEVEFRDMLEFFCQFTIADLYTIRDPRVRTIMEGVISSSDEPAVYRAFEVLFEDLAPIRIAGRIIYGKLKQIVQDAHDRGQTEVETIVETTGLSHERVQASRLAFLTLAAATEYGVDQEAHLTLDQLVDSGLANTAMDLMGFENKRDFLGRLEGEEEGKVTFPEFMIGLQQMAEETCATDVCDPAIVLQTVATEMEPALSSPNLKLDKKRQEFSDRYDTMVNSFNEWDDVVPTGEGRRLDVLRGCFVGARNKRVVEALRVVYIDYAALRLAGNSIFALTKSLVSQLRKRASSKQAKQEKKREKQRR